MKYTISLFAILFAGVNTLAVARDSECADEGTTCPTIDCCGTATPVSGASTKQICNDKDATVWYDVDTGNAAYKFACNEVSLGALALTMSSGLMLASMSALY